MMPEPHSNTVEPPSPSSYHSLSTQKTPVFRAHETGRLGVPTNLSLVGEDALSGSSSSASRGLRTAGLTTSSKTIVEKRSGRNPWYDALGLPRQAYIIGVAGGSASGKTSVATRILKRLNVPTVAVVSQDSFYKELTPEQSKLAFANNWDFDCEDAFDQELLRQCIIDLKNGRSVEVPVYSFVQHQRTAETKYLYGASVIIVEGLFVLSDPAIRELLDLKLFVQADSDLMLARRITRDTKERGRELSGVIEHYLRWVKPAMDNYISPTSKWADLIVPGQRNEVAVDVVAQHVKRQLDDRALRFRSELSQAPVTVSSEAGSTPEGGWSLALAAGNILVPMSRTPSSTSLAEVGTGHQHSNNLNQAVLPPSVHLLPPSPQLLGLLTIMHDASAEDFVFYTDRVCLMLMEATLNFLPHRERVVKCGGTGQQWTGKELAVDDICAVAIQRSGSVLTKAARRVIPALTLGSLLIQSSDEDGEPQLYDVTLPDMIRKRSRAQASHVLLLDAQIGTGAAAFMAIRVLLDHCVPQENIIFVSILASHKGGIWALARAFPRVRVVLAGVDGGLKKCRVEYPRVQGRASGASEIGSQLSARVKDRDLDSSTQEPAASSDTKTKVLWTILPGMGSIGDRYYRTD
ncbi:unnamed protein product [Parajaminaea phylloscopi]